MGVYYYLNHAELEESFELNKSPNGWRALEKTSVWIDRESLLEALMVEMNTGWNADGMMAYCLWLRDELWEWNNRFPGPRMYKAPTLVNDASDFKIHKITGSRFPPNDGADDTINAHFRQRYGG